MFCIVDIQYFTFKTVNILQFYALCISHSMHSTSYILGIQYFQYFIFYAFDIFYIPGIYYFAF